jgi:hypothetical protein
MAIERFKLEDGREGYKATLDCGLIKMIFDDGELLILVPNDRVPEDIRSPKPVESFHRPPEPQYPRITARRCFVWVTGGIGWPEFQRGAEEPGARLSLSA